MNNDNDSDTATMTGTVIFLKKNIGSKSEGTYPCLYQDKDRITPIRMRDDNPFENRALRPWDGKTIEISGTFGRSGVFLISAIRQIASDRANPAAGSAAETDPKNETDSETK